MLDEKLESLLSNDRVQKPVRARDVAELQLSIEVLKPLMMASDLMEFTQVRAAQMGVGVEEILVRAGLSADVAHQWLGVRAFANLKAPVAMEHLANLADAMELFDQELPGEKEGLKALCDAAKRMDLYDGLLEMMGPKTQKAIQKVRPLADLSMVTSTQREALLNCQTFHELMDVRMKQLCVNAAEVGMAAAGTTGFLYGLIYSSREGHISLGKYKGLDKVAAVALTLGLTDDQLVGHLCHVSGKDADVDAVKHKITNLVATLPTKPTSRVSQAQLMRQIEPVAAEHSQALLEAYHFMDFVKLRASQLGTSVADIEADMSRCDGYIEKLQVNRKHNGAAFISDGARADDGMAKLAIGLRVSEPELVRHLCELAGCAKRADAVIERLFVPQEAGRSV